MASCPCGRKITTMVPGGHFSFNSNYLPRLTLSLMAFSSVPVLFYCDYTDGINQFPITMDTSTWAEEQITMTLPTQKTTGWQAGHEPTFQFAGNTITDQKGMWLSTVAQINAFDSLPVGTVIADYTQTNRLNYLDCCGDRKSVV